MKKLSTLILVMTLCLSLLQIGFNSTPTDANNGTAPIGTSTILSDNDEYICQSKGLADWRNLTVCKSKKMLSLTNN